MEPGNQAFRGTAAKPLGSGLARRPSPARSPWHGQLSRQPAAVGSPCSPVSQGSESLWSQLPVGHVLALVSGCSISSKSRYSDGAATHWASQTPISPLRPADCACVGYQLPVSLASLFVALQSPLRILQVLFTLWLGSCALSAPVRDPLGLRGTCQQVPSH